MREIVGNAKTVRELLKGVKYEEKLPHYLTQNLLARSLHPQCYMHNPGFLRFKEQSGLPFAPLTQFMKTDVETRSLLYSQIAQRIWNPDDLLHGGQP